MRDGRTTTNEQVKIELHNRWKLEAEFRNFIFYRVLWAPSTYQYYKSYKIYKSYKNYKNYKIYKDYTRMGQNTTGNNENREQYTYIVYVIQIGTIYVYVYL